MKKQFLFLAVLLSLLSSHVSAAQMYDFIVDGVYYKIQYGLQKSVYVSPRSHSDNTDSWTSGHTGDIVIPESVTYNGETYPVEGIQNYAFQSSSVTSVTIAASVQYIAGSVFNNCRQLTKIINLSPTPQNITSTTFDSYDCTLYVPDGSVSDYQSANYWKNFTIKSVSELNSFGVSDVAVQRGTPQSVDINLDNISANIVGFQFDLRLPEGLSLVTTSTGAVNVTATIRLGGSYTLRGKLQSDGTYRFVYVANPNGNSAPTPISGTSGSLFSVKIQAGDAAKDGVATVSNITITDNNVNETSLNDASFNITVAKSGKCGDNLTWTLDDDGLLKIEGSGPMYNYAFSYDTYTTNTPWYSYKDEITSIELSENMTSIGDEAFDGCTNLTSIIIPDAVTSIGEGAFVDCRSLKSVTIGSGLRSIGTTAFDESNTLDKIYIKDLSAWCNISGLGCLTSGNNVSKTLYINGEEVSNLEIPDGTTAIPALAFYSFKNITSVVIPSSVTTIGDRAFRNCLNLNDVYNYATSPQTITGNTFHPDTHTLYVPKASVSAYQGANYWKNFNIQPIVNVVASGTCGDNLTWTLDDEGLLTIEGTGAMYDFGEKPASPWLEYAEQISSLSIGNSVTSISRYAFVGCEGLSTVEIPSSVTNIGVGAFLLCSSLSSINVSADNIQYSSQDGVLFNKAKTRLVECPMGKAGEYTIPNTVTEIGSNSFGSCTNLTSVVIPAGVTIIKDNAFNGCSNLEYINIPDGVTSIGSEAFRECYKLSSISFPNSVTEIGGFAFYCCYGLTELVIPESLNIIQDYAFCDCVGLTSVVIPNTVTSIGEFAFCDCFGLKSFVIPNSVNSIGAYAFRDCHNLTCVEIPNSVTSIGECAFAGCSKLEELTNLSITPQAIHDGTFSHYGNLYVPKTSVSAYQNADYWKNFTIKPIVNVVASGTCGDNLTWTLDDEGLLTIEGTGDMNNYTSGKAPWYSYRSDIKSLSIGNSVTSIGDAAFMGCYGLTSVEIPKSVTSIGSDAFHNCFGLTSVVIPNSMTSIKDGVFAGCSNLVDITIPSSVTSIADFAFNGCSGLTSVVIPNSVTSIGEGTFSYCSGLTSVVIPNSVTSIGGWAFSGCSGLTSVVIPNSVTSIGDAAFMGCYGLTSVEISNSVTNIGSDAFLDCSGLTSVVIPNSVTSIGYQSFCGCSGLTSVVIPNSVTSIGDVAFADCSGLTSVTIPNSVTSIGGSAFSGCSGLTSVVIPNSLTSIGDYAFEGCSGLTSVVIPNSMTSIKDGVFAGCSNLVDITIPSSVTTIHGAAFDGCENISIIRIEDVGAWCNIHGLDPFMRLYDVGKTLYIGGEIASEIVIPEGITNIPDYAFCLCNNITSVKIANTVTYIGLAAFGFCSSLTSVEIPNSVEYIEVGAFAYTNLTSVHSTSLTPAYCGTLNGMSPFTDISEASTLYVHASVVDAYRSAYGWNEIANIIGVENGDVNLDNKVNVTDAVEIVNNVIGDASERFVECWSDVNSDNQYTIADAMAVVNIILGEEIGASYAMNHAPMAENDQLSLYSTDSSNITLAMDNMMQYSSFQFDVNLPEGITLENVTLNQNRCQDFSVLFRETGENKYTVAVFNFGNEPFATGSGSLVDMSLSGNVNLSETSVSNIHFSTTGAVDVQFEDVTMSNTNGIDIVNENEYENEYIYDLSGRRLSGAQRGVNIVNGKKIIIR